MVSCVGDEQRLPERGDTFRRVEDGFGSRHSVCIDATVELRNAGRDARPPVESDLPDAVVIGVSDV